MSSTFKSPTPSQCCRPLFCLYQYKWPSSTVLISANVFQIWSTLARDNAKLEFNLSTLKQVYYSLVHSDVTFATSGLFVNWRHWRYWRYSIVLNSDMGIPALIPARGAPSYGWLWIRLQRCPSLKAFLAGVRKRRGREKYVRGRRPGGPFAEIPRDIFDIRKYLLNLWSIWHKYISLTEMNSVVRYFCRIVK